MGIAERRHPLEDETVSIARAASSTIFPANFIMVAAMNPCPWGERVISIGCGMTFFAVILEINLTPLAIA